jgi:hypothetical protein
LNRNGKRWLVIAAILSATVCMVLSGCGFGRARPLVDELYEARLGDGPGTVQIVTTRWSDGSYRDGPFVQFRDGRGGAWVVACPSGEPKSWDIVHIDEDQFIQKLTAEKSMTLPGPWIYKLRFAPARPKPSEPESKPSQPHERF